LFSVGGIVGLGGDVGVSVGVVGGPGEKEAVGETERMLGVDVEERVVEALGEVGAAGVGVREGVGLEETPRDTEAIGVALGVPVWEAVPVGLAETLGEVEALGEGDNDRVDVGETLVEAAAVGLALGAGVWEAVPVGLAETLGEAEALGEGNND
jgi:hypothetical protein